MEAIFSCLLEIEIEWSKHQVLPPDLVFDRVEMRLDKLTPGKAFVISLIQFEFEQDTIKKYCGLSQFKVSGECTKVANILNDFCYLSTR